MCASAQASAGSSVAKPKDAVMPTWSISSPAMMGASALDIAGPRAIQLNTRLSSLGSSAISPASRCMATAATATAPPHSRQPMAMAHSCCTTSASKAPAPAISTPTPTGR